MRIYYLTENISRFQIEGPQMLLEEHAHMKASLEHMKSDVDVEQLRQQLKDKQDEMQAQRAEFMTQIQLMEEQMLALEVEKVDQWTQTDEPVSKKSPKKSQLDLSPKRSQLELSPKRSQLELSPKRSQLELSPKRSQLELSPKRTTIGQSVKKSQLDLSPKRSQLELSPKKSQLELSPKKSLDLARSLVKTPPITDAPPVKSQILFADASTSPFRVATISAESSTSPARVATALEEFSPKSEPVDTASSPIRSQTLNASTSPTKSQTLNASTSPMTQLQRDASTSPTKSQTLKEIGTNTQLLQDTARALDSVKMSDASLSPIKQLQSTNTTTLRKPEMVDAGTTKKPEMTDASVSSHPPETIDVGISAQMRMTDIGISAQTRMRDANNSPIRSLARVNEDPEQDLGQTHESVEFDQLQELRKIAQLAQSEMIQLQRKIGEQQLRIQKLQNRSLKDKIIDLTQELSQLEPQEQRMILKPILGEPKDDRMRNEVKRRNLILSKLNQIFDQKLGLKNLKTIQSFEQLQEELLIKASKIPTILHVNMLLDSQKMLFSNKIQQLDDRMSMVQQKMAHLKASQEPKDYRITKLETELQLTREQHHKDQQIYKQRLTHVLEEKRKMEQDLELCLNKLSQIGIRPKSPKTKKIPEVQLKRTLNVQDYARALAEGERLRMLLDKEHEQQKRIIERVQDLLNQHQQQPNLMAALEHLKQELMSGFD